MILCFFFPNFNLFEIAWRSSPHLSRRAHYLSVVNVLLFYYLFHELFFTTFMNNFFPMNQCRLSIRDIYWFWLMINLFIIQGHLIKNPSTQRAKSLLEIPSAHRIIISGTPLQNNLKVSLTQDSLYCHLPFVFYPLPFINPIHWRCIFSLFPYSVHYLHSLSLSFSLSLIGTVGPVQFLLSWPAGWQEVVLIHINIQSSVLLDIFSSYSCYLF